MDAGHLAVRMLCRNWLEQQPPPRPGQGLLGLMPCGPVHLLTHAPHGVNRLPATCTGTSEGQSVMGEVPSTARESVPHKDHNDIVFRKLDVFPYFAIRSANMYLKQNIYFYLNIDPIVNLDRS